jgi:type II secretory pathway pseudopilin PulG
MSRRLERLHRDERGFGLVDTLVSTALLGVALVVLVGSLSTFALASRQAEDRALAQAVARAQAARIKAAPYQATGDYSAYYETLPSDFSRSVTVTWWDGTSSWSAIQNANGLEKIALAINSSGQPIVSLELVKADR